jgi:hypothetical protein
LSDFPLFGIARHALVVGGHLQHLSARNLHPQAAGDGPAFKRPFSASSAFRDGDRQCHRCLEGLQRLRNARRRFPVPHTQKIAYRSVVEPPVLPVIVFFREFSEGFGHVEQARLIIGIGDLLRQPHAFRGISTIIDSGKQRHPMLPDTQR